MNWLSKLLLMSVLFGWGVVAHAQNPNPVLQTLIVTDKSTLGTDSAAASMVFNGPVASQRILQWSTAGSRRWSLYANAGAEGGNNAGSDLQLLSGNDTGGPLGTVAIFTRSNGNVSFNPVLNFPSPTYTFNGDVVIPGRFGNQLQIYPSGTVTVPAGTFNFNQNPVYFNFNYASNGVVTPTTEMFLLGFNLPSETLQLDDATAANNLALIWAGWVVGGPGDDPATATTQGQRLGIDMMMRHKYPANGASTVPFTMLGQRLSVIEDTPKSGTNINAGSIEGIDLVITRTKRSTAGVLSMAGLEIDMAAETGALPPLLKYGLMVYSAANDGQGSSMGDAAIHFAAGNFVTGWRCHICLGKPGSPTSLTPNTTIFGTVPYRGQDGLTAVGANPPSPVNQQARNGIEFSRIIFNGAGSGTGMAFAAPGFVVDDLGATYHTSGKLLGTSAGLAIDTPLYVLKGGVTVVTASTTGRVFDSDYAWDETCKVRGAYQLTVVGTAVTAVSVIDPPACASNPATLVLKSAAGTVTVNTTWTAPAAQVISVGASAGLVQMATATALKNTTVGALPACNAGSKFQSYVVSDANAPTYNATLAGGGAVVAVAVCDGLTWKAH
jgi:hypothetical protein